MKFNQDNYLTEMKAMVDKAFNKLRIEQPAFEIYTVSIWTDPDAAASSISFDSKTNSDKSVQESNEWNKTYYEQYLAEGNLEQAKLFEPTISRNCNPADFELRDFEEIENTSIPDNWEEETNGKCWDELEPALQKIGEYTFKKLKELKIATDCEVAVNGRNDWYEFTW